MDGNLLNRSTSSRINLISFRIYAVGAGDMFGDEEKGIGARITCQAVGLAACPGIG